MNNKSKNTGTSLTIIILFVAAFIMINLIATSLTDKFSLKLDLTDSKLYGISSETKEYMSKIENDIDVYYFTSNVNEKSSVKEIVERFCQTSPHLKMHIVDYVKNPSATSKYTSLGKNIGSNTVVFDNGEKFKVLTYDDMLSYNYFSGNKDILVAESKFTSAVMSVERGKNIKIGFIDGHGEKGTDTLTEYLNDNNNDYASVNLSRGELNDEFDMAVILAPQTDYTADEINSLDAFLKSGKNLEVFLDYNTPNLPKLQAYLEEWGIIYDSNFIVEGDPSKIVGNYPYYISPSLNEHEITNSLISGNVMPIIPMSRSITAKWEAKNGVTVTSLAETTNKSYAKNPDAQSITKESSDKSGPFTLIMLAESETSKIIAFGSSQFLQNSMMDFNKDLWYNSINWSSTNEEPVEISPKSITSLRLKISQTAMIIWFIILTILLPLAVLIAGVKVWVSRRHL